MRRPAMAGLALVAGAVTCVALVLSGCGRDQPASMQVGTTTFAPEEREPMPNLAGETLDGVGIALNSFRGRVVVLNAWASWCGPCVDEVPELTRLDEEWDDSDIAVLGLDVSDDPAAAREFTDKAKVGYASIVDPDGTILPTIPGVPPRAVPSTVVIDRDGRLAARIVGEIDPTELNRIVVEVANEPAG